MSADRISAEALLTRIESGAAPVILDVRSRAEFASGHVPGARHIPFWRISRRIGELSFPRDAELVVYCGHGPRAVDRRARVTAQRVHAHHVSRGALLDSGGARVSVKRG